jgi:hypothetical protein
MIDSSVLIVRQDRTAALAAELPSTGADSGSGRPHRLRCRPPGLRLSLGECGVCGAVPTARHHICWSSLVRYTVRLLGAGVLPEIFLTLCSTYSEMF